jgi:four helix bundle protein
MGDFMKLAVWQKAHELTLQVYERTASWPRHELFGLTSQIRRAAASIAANIAEGCGRNSDAELARYARTSLASANELSYYVILARDLSYLDSAGHDDLERGVSEVRRMLSSLERVSALAAARAKLSAHRRRVAGKPVASG